MCATFKKRTCQCDKESYTILLPLGQSFFDDAATLHPTKRHLHLHTISPKLALAALSATSFSSTPTSAGTHRKPTLQPCLSNLNTIVKISPTMSPLLSPPPYAIKADNESEHTITVSSPQSFTHQSVHSMATSSAVKIDIPPGSLWKRHGFTSKQHN